MKIQTGLVALSLSFAGNAYNDDQGKAGLELDVGVSGFFSSVLESAEISFIESNSPAEKAGLQVGDRIVAIDDCQVPGCLTSEAKQRLKRHPGDLVPIVIQRDDDTQVYTTLRLE
ncbi:PDZ domain-containing protein [Algibacillus agarilyticus]|uniref:PDZ domain-containing protein n=1 Tax=Algibacillus agarilyticus TaxID=2234133 RepID=UPI000DD084C7|nr:PDZ domain-containing protein [Algibacillus agarilyticus]